MKKWMGTLVVVFIVMFSMTSYAGQWSQDVTGWRYQNDDGSYENGWFQDVDGKWYYFDSLNGYMLVNSTTPDGFQVGASGAWLEGQTLNGENAKSYENCTELKISAFKFPGGIETLKNEVIVKVHYNNTYDNAFTGKIRIEGFDISKDGVAYVNLSLDQADIALLNTRCRYYLDDGTYEDMDWSLLGNFEKPDDKVSTQLFKLYRTSINSAEIWIDNAQ